MISTSVRTAQSRVQVQSGGTTINRLGAFVTADGPVTCMQLTTAQLNSLIAAGWTMHSGPYSSQALCEASCSADPPDPPPSDISRSVIGAGTTTSGDITITCIIPEAGLLVVLVGGVGTVSASATFDSDPMIEDAGAGISTPEGISMSAHIFSLEVTATTADVVVTLSGGTDGMAVVFLVTGLVNNVADRTKETTYTSTAVNPEIGATTTTAEADEYVQSFFWMRNPVPLSGFSWANSYTAGESDGISSAGDDYLLAEGYRVLTAVGTPNGALSGISIDGGVGLTATYS